MLYKSSSVFINCLLSKLSTQNNVLDKVQRNVSYFVIILSCNKTGLWTISALRALMSDSGCENLCQLITSSFGLQQLQPHATHKCSERTVVHKPIYL